MGARGFVGCAGRVVLCAGLFAWPAPALAGDRLELPPGQDRESWRVPVALAGLELDPSSTPGTRIRIEAGPDGWVLRATGIDGAVRIARVDAPETASQREDVAFLARSLARTIAAGEAPAPAPTRSSLPLPPPPPVRPRPAPVPEPVPAPATLPEPVAANEPPVEPTPEPTPVEDTAAPPVWETVLLPEGIVVGEREDLVLVELDPPPPRRRRGRLRGRVESPPMQLTLPAVFRLGTSAGFAPALGIDVARIRNTTFGYELGWTPPRPLSLELDRGYTSVDLIGRASTPIGRIVGVAPIGGVSYRTFRQQGNAIGTAVAPVFGGEIGLHLARVGRMSFGLVGRGTLDLALTQLVLDDGSEETLAGWGVQSGLVIRFSGSRDPFREESTSSSRTADDSVAGGGEDR